jgi:hypothetical protein
LVDLDRPLTRIVMLGKAASTISQLSTVMPLSSKTLEVSYVQISIDLLATRPYDVAP